MVPTFLGGALVVVVVGAGVVVGGRSPGRDIRGEEGGDNICGLKGKL